MPSQKDEDGYMDSLCECPLAGILVFFQTVSTTHRAHYTSYQYFLISQREQTVAQFSTR